MSVYQIKQKYPEVFREIYNRGIRAEKHRQYRARVLAEIRETVRQSSLVENEEYSF